MINPGLVGRVALVTGANQGIGAAVARALSSCGAGVLLTYLRLDPAVHAADPAFPAAYDELRARTADSVLAQITAAGGRAIALEADLGDPSTPAQVFDHAEATLGPVDILVNNADAWVADTFLPDATDRLGRRLTPVTAETYERSFAVNSRAVALLISEFARRHRARGASWGRIISLTTGGAAGFPQEVSYGASKNALESYTRAAAQELAPFGITANVLCPPVTDTGWITPQVEEQVRRAGPLGRVGQPDEVAEVIVILASHQARFITGQMIAMW